MENLNMLNEGYLLYKSLIQCGIQLENSHPDVKNPGKKEGLIVGLDKTGNVARIEYRNADDIANLWTIREGNHNSFPVLKLQRPIWKVDKDDKLRKEIEYLKKDEAKKKELLLGNNFPLNLTEVEQNWWQRLHNRISVLQPIFNTSIKEFEALSQLIRRFLLITNVETFLLGLLDIIKQKPSEIPYPSIESILIGKKWVKSKQEFVSEFPVILDVNDWEQFSKRVASPSFENYVCSCLFDNERQTSISLNKEMKISALTGDLVVLEDDKFPCPKLPIGESYLFSVNDQTPCFTRYNQTSVKIFPVGRHEAISVQRALKWITNKDREGKTWCFVPGPIKGDIELLIVYLYSKPDLKINKAYLLGGISKDDFSDSDYEAVSKIAIEALKAEKIVRANDLIRIFCIRSADLARKQITLKREYTVSEILKSNEAWREAAGNIADLSVPFFRNEIERAVKNIDIIYDYIRRCFNNNTSVICVAPVCPFPADLVYISQKQWIRYGSDSVDVKGFSLGEVYDVFFSTSNEKKLLIESMLNTSLQRAQPLLIELGNAEHKNNFKEIPVYARIAALRTASAFAILLYKLNIKKEDYMKDTFYNVGKFLSLIDTLHFEWCRHMRGGYPEKEEKEWRKAIPPQLLGNAYLQIALDNPESAFDLLSKRIGIYQAWTFKEEGEKIKLAIWAVSQLRKVSDLLVEKPLPSSTTSAERAQILLGYLASAEKKEENKTDNI